jgi:hypothetical protein
MWNNERGVQAVSSVRHNAVRPVFPMPVLSADSSSAAPPALNSEEGLRPGV